MLTITQAGSKGSSVRLPVAEKPSRRTHRFKDTGNTLGVKKYFEVKGFYRIIAPNNSIEC